MTVEEALEVLGYLLGHEKAVDSGEMEDVQNCLNSQEQEALKVILSEFRELKEKATAKKVVDKLMYLECPNCGDVGIEDCGYCPCCGQKLDWSEGKEAEKKPEWQEAMMRTFLGSRK